MSAEHPDKGDKRRTGRGVAAPVVYAGLGVVGLMLQLVRGPGDWFGLLVLLCALSYLVWWAALERASVTPRLSVGRRFAACALATGMVAVCHATMAVSIGEAIHGGRVLQFFVGLGVMLTLGSVAWWGPQFWETLAEQPPLAGARRLLQVITGSAAGAFVLNVSIPVFGRLLGLYRTGPLLVMAIGGAALVLAWTVVPWLRCRRAATHAVRR